MAALVHVCSIESSIESWVQKPAKAKAAVEDSEFVDETDALISGLEAIQVSRQPLRPVAAARKPFAPKAIR
jgi:hypothetical protein